MEPDFQEQDFSVPSEYERSLEPAVQVQNAPVPSEYERALIPNNIVEFRTQHLLAFAVFSLIQYLKIGSIWKLYTYQGNSPLINYCFADVIFLLVLYLVQIPRLQFSVHKILKIYVLLCCINLLVMAIPFYGFGDLTPQPLQVHRSPAVNLGCSQEKPINLLVSKKSVPLPLEDLTFHEPVCPVDVIEYF